MDAMNVGFKVVERTDAEGNGSGLLQIFSPTEITDDQII